MKSRKGNKPAEYTFIGFRPTKAQDCRLRALSKKSGLPVSRIVHLCIDRELVKLEAALVKE